MKTPSSNLQVWLAAVVPIIGFAQAAESTPDSFDPATLQPFTTTAPYLGKYEITPLIAPAGPLRVCAANPRYFADASGRPVYLTGSHTWQSLQDGILSNYTSVTQPFDYAGDLSLLQTNHHNFIRLWRWELTTHEPQPWLRTGPGHALDGRLKFDLRQFNQAYFDRLRSRVIAARDRGIYVGIMLFEDWIFMNKRTDFPLNQHPFHKDNNVSGINGDPNGDGWGVEIHMLQVPAALEVQQAYVRKVIETVNDLDKVLYEICNEGGRHTREWQYEMVRFVKSVEAKLPKQHPVGMTSVGDMNEDCLGSGADWTSLATTGWDRPKDPWTSDPPAATGEMVCLMDTDHIGWKVFITDAAFTRAWVWKSFTRGHNTLLMENLADSEGWIAGRAAMGHTRRLAERVNLAKLTPHPELASTRYCLAQPGHDYVVYLPAGGDVTVDLSAASGPLAVEWIHPAEGNRQSADSVMGGGQRAFRAPFPADSVLYIRAERGTTQIPMVFPGKDWNQATPESQVIDSARLRAALDYLARSLAEHGGADTVFIVRNGYAIWQGPECDREFQIFSATKSVTSTMLGLLIDDGKVTLDTFAKKFEPALAEQYPGVMLRHFATMTSGYDSAGGSYEFDAQGRGDSWNPGPPAPPIFLPGTKFRYWDDAMSQFGQVLTKAAGQPLDQLFKSRIAEPIGMTRWRWTSNDTPSWRVLCWTGGLRTSSRELARFGHLFLNRGTWDGQQLISTSWVDQATTVRVPSTTPNDALPRSRGAGVYGFNWWVNGRKPDGKRLWPGAPPRTYYANGLHNNVCIVVPEWRMVIARTNGARKDGSVGTPANVDDIWSEFFSRLAEAIMP